MKKLTLLIILVFYSFGMVYSQTWDELNQKVIEYYNKGDYSTAFEYAEKAKLRAAIEFGTEHLNYATSLNNLARLYSDMGNYTKAEPLYIETLNINKKVLGPDHPSYATSLNNLAWLYSKMGNYTKAEPLYLEALNTRKKVLGTEHPDYTMSLNNLASLYDEMGNYDKAEPLYIEALNTRKKVLGTEHRDYAMSLNNLASLYDEMGNYDKAEPLYIEAMNIYKKVLGPDHPSYATSLDNLALLYYDMGNYAKAEPLYIEALNTRKKILGTEHPDYATSLNNLAVLYSKMGNYNKAESLLIEALNITKKVYGPTHPAYATSLNNLAWLYKEMGNYAKAEPLYIEALNTKKKVFGPDHPSYANSLDNLALLYYNIGNYAKAEPLYIEALNIYKKVLGPNHPSYANSLDNLAGLYSEMGNYSKAEPLYLEALNTKKKVLGLDHPEYAISLNNFALLYDKIGNYDKAELLYIEALNIYKKVLGPDHPSYANSLNNLALLYFKIGNYAKAEPLYIEALNTRKKVLGTDHPDYAISLNNLALLYAKMSNYDKAEPLYIEALNILKKVLGIDHPFYASSLDNLAGLYSEMGNYDKAEPIYIEALNTRKKVLGPDHPAYANSLNNFAVLYAKMGNYAKAEPLYIEALNTRKKVLGTEHPDYAMSLNNLASLYDDMGNYDRAKSFLIQANDKLNKQIEKNFAFLSEIEKEQFLNNEINYYFEIYNSFFLRRMGQDPSLIATSYNNELSHKGMLLQSSTALYQAVYSNGDKMLIETYNRFITIHKKLSELYSKPLSERKINTDSLENLANELEKGLAQKANELPGLENLTGITKVKWNDVQKSLKPDEAAIEFVNFRYLVKRWTDSIYYCALVLRKGYKYPKMIYLFEERQLKDFISKPEAVSDVNYITKLYSCKPVLPTISDTSLAKNVLYRLIWQPIDSLLHGISTIYIAPAGLLNKVAFNAMPITDSTFLSDAYRINVVSSTSTLAHAKKTTTSLSVNTQAVLYGGIEYDVDSTELVSMAKQFQKPGYDLLANRSIDIPEENRGNTWSYLPGTFTEVSNIEKIFQSKKIPSSVYSGMQATEESFKHLAEQQKSPEILHIATHGFFFSEIKTNLYEKGRGFIQQSITEGPVFTYSGNPLLRCGILLSGANRTWKNLPAIEGVEDGTLTAYEVSNLNLSNTWLVVLSACETGLGDIKGSEGVFGLNRAFKMAGVRYTIMSLWQVPDYQTSELMQLFYTNWLNGMDIKEAFNRAQLSLRKKYDPYYWAAFVLIE